MGESLHEILDRTRHRVFRDRRTQFHEITLAQQNGMVHVRGAVIDSETAYALMHALRLQAPNIHWRDELTPLVKGPDYHWALMARAVADVRREPRASAERVTQALFGEAIEVLRRQDDWAFVRMRDGYLGWMHIEPLQVCTPEVAHSYVEQATHIVKNPFAPCYSHPSGAAHEQIALLPFGVQVIAEGHDGPMLRIRWPDGHLRWAWSADLLPHDQVSQRTRAGLELVVTWLDRLLGTPYLWGGKTPWGYDCSGFVQTIYNVIGVHLRRDADQQVEQGTAATLDALRFGDLVFFDTALALEELAQRGPVRVTHVALALGPHDFLHAMSRGGGLIRSSFDAQSPLYVPHIERRVIAVRRHLHENSVEHKVE